MSTDTSTPGTLTTGRGVVRAFTIIVGLAALAVLLQGLWAGLFIHEGEDYKESWVSVHARGADIAILLTIVAFVLAVTKLRQRKDLVYGTAVMAVLLILEAYLGGLVGDKPGALAFHLPLAMGLMGLSVWLPMRARSL